MKKVGCLYRKRLAEVSNLLIAMYGPPADRVERDGSGVERKVGEFFTDSDRGCTIYLWGQTGRVEVEGPPGGVIELCEQLAQYGLLKEDWTRDSCEDL